MKNEDVKFSSPSSFPLYELNSRRLNSTRWYREWRKYMFPMGDGSLQIGKGVPPHYCFTALNGNEGEILKCSLLSLDMALFIKGSVSILLRTSFALGAGEGNSFYRLSFSDRNGLEAQFFRSSGGVEQPLCSLTLFEDQVHDARGYNNYKIGVFDEGDNVRLLLYVNDVPVINCLDVAVPHNIRNGQYTVFQGDLSMIRFRGTDTQLEYHPPVAKKSGQYQDIDCYDLTALDQYSLRDLRTAFAPLTFVASNDVRFPYRLLLPADYSPQKKYPLVLYLHGGNVRGTDNITQLMGDLRQLSMILNHQKKEPFIFVIPQAPANLFWTDYDYQTKFYQVKTDPAPRTSCALAELLIHLSSRFSVDPSRRYLAGCFMGGYGTMDMICRYPNLFAAAFCGYSCEEFFSVAPDLLSTAAQTPLYLVHGIPERAITTEMTHGLSSSLQQHGADLIYRQFPFSPYDFIPEEEASVIMNWLFSKRK